MFKEMKLRAAIFAIIIGFLTIHPVFSKNPMGNFAEKKSCSGAYNMQKKCSKESGKENKDCSPEGCNPFMPCAIGNFFLNETPYHQNDAVIILSNEKNL